MCRIHGNTSSICKHHSVSFSGYVKTWQMSMCLSPFTFVVSVFLGADVCGIHANTSSFCEP